MESIKSLIEKFELDIVGHMSPDYNEYRTRTDFISPFLKLLGWDVSNDKGLPNTYREVIEEAYLKSEDSDDVSRPDYELRIAGERKVFVEAKKVSVNIESDKKAVFQTRRYGYTAGLPITILTNFRQLAVYDTTVLPEPGDATEKSRILLLDFAQYEDNFERIESYLSRKEVAKSNFISSNTKKKRKGELSFDEHFLGKIKEWRVSLAQDLYRKNKGITPRFLTLYTQKIISRIIFLRICEDRNIEKYESLLNCSKSGFDDLVYLLEKSDKKYNAGLFKLSSELKLRVSSSVIKEIIEDLYYPNSPYSFSVLEPEIIGGIYDQFLCEEISIENSNVSLVYKPEYREAGGVINTPKAIAKKMAELHLGRKISSISLKELESFKVIDICCGSGMFLLTAYDILEEEYLRKYISDTKKHLGQEIIQTKDGEYTLSYNAKKKIIVNNIYGVDIDGEATELAKLSLSLKLIENEYTLPEKSILPNLDANIKCGNSLISYNEWCKYNEDEDVFDSQNAFDWDEEYEEVMSSGGFDLIIGNPPYVRIQKMKKYSLEELNYYQSGLSPYETTVNKSIDKYFLFIERSMSLLSEEGELSYLVPNKFIANQYGSSLRSFITKGRMLKGIINFGSIHVFKGKALNYTCILNLSKRPCENLISNKVTNLDEWLSVGDSKETIYDNSLFNCEPWVFPSEKVSKILSLCQKNSKNRLKDVADIFVGLQTSADDIYIFDEEGSDDEFYYFNKEGVEYKIEKSITKGFAWDLPISKYKQPEANSRLIFPYYFDHEGKVNLYSPSEMAIKFPHALLYLENFKDRLRKRKITGGKREQKQWYQYGRSQSLNKMVGEKIIFPVHSKTFKYAPERNSISVTGGGNGPYYLIKPKSGYSIDFLLALLNNYVSESQVRLCTSIIGNGYYAHNKEFIENLLVPNLSPRLTKEISSISRELQNEASKEVGLSSRYASISKRKTKMLEKKLDEEICKAFGISFSDYQELSLVSPE